MATDIHSSFQKANVQLPPEIRKLYPFDSNFLTLEAGVKMHFIDEGEGVPVLMFHGNPTWSFFYRNLILNLKDQFRCIAPDHIGCGLSDKPQTYAYTLEQHIQNAKKLVQALNLEHYHLVFHDWGGPIGLALAEKWPNRVGKIVILNTAAFIVDGLPWELKLCRLGKISEYLIRGANAFVNGAIAKSTVNKLPKEVAAGYRYPYKNWKERIAVYEFVQDIPVYEQHPSYDVLKKIEADLWLLADKPVHIFWGDKDFIFTKKYFDQWQFRFPTAHSSYYPKAGHYLMEDESQSIIGGIRAFLK